MAIKDLKDYPYRIELKVRDYECDLQGIVNHANYIHYCEHARHEALLDLGGSFRKMHDEGEDIVVARLKAEYRVSLRSGDEFYVDTAFSRLGVRVVCTQKITRKSDGVTCLMAEVHAVLVKDGELTTGETLFDILLQQQQRMKRKEEKKEERQRD